MIKCKNLHLGIIFILLISSLIFSSCEINKTPVDILTTVSENAENASNLESVQNMADHDPLSFQELSQKTDSLDYIVEIDKNNIMTFEITADPAEWQTMLDNAELEEYISADVTINGETVKNVGIRTKGNSSLSSIVRDSTSDRYSFKIEFDHYEEGQTWKGLDKLAINNMYSDSSYMKEYISYDIMNYIGVDMPLYAFADIKVNGEEWGFYLAVECYEDSYVERVHGGEGELYKPESTGMGGVVWDVAERFDRNENDRANQSDENVMAFPDFNFNPNSEQRQAQETSPQEKDNDNATVPRDKDEELNIMTSNGFRMMGGAGGSSGGIDLKYTDDKTESYSAIFNNSVFKCNIADYERVITALKNLNDGTELEKYVDIEAVLKYFAAHTAVVSLDSYVSGMAHNYYLYENGGQISILPWDYNMAFGGFQSGNASDVINFPIDTPVSGVSLEDRPLIGKLLEVPEYFEKYHSYIAEILDGYFNNGKFEQRVDEINSLISEYVKNDPTAFTKPEEYDKAVTALKEFGKLRAQSMQGQLDGTVPSTTEAQKNAKDKLIDASSLNLSDLGNMGGGMFNIRRNENGEEISIEGNIMLFDQINPDILFEAVEIINLSENGILSDEQRQKLYDMDLTDEQIEQIMSNMMQPRR